MARLHPPLMADQAPRFGAKAGPRKAWAPSSRLRPVERKRGRAGQRDRAKVIAEEPLCRTCLDQGRTSPTEFVDHIKPLAWGGSDERSNKQGLCKPCHDAKSAAERALDRQTRV
jgi:5-methylcytosine-specific restriction protein A